MSFLDTYWLFVICVLFLASRHFSKKGEDWKGTSITFSCLMWICVSTFIVRVLFWEVYITNGTSMLPSLPSKSILVVNKQTYKWSLPGIKQLHAKSPQRDEIVVFSQHYKNDDEVWVKRVVGQYGDIITFIDKKGWYLNGNFISTAKDKDLIWLEHGGFPKNYALQHIYKNDIKKQMLSGNSWSVQIPKGYIFVVGDNFKTSVDSRQVGFISLDKVIGRVDLHISSISNSKESVS